MSKFKQKSIIARDVAEQQVELFFEYYDLDPDFIPDAIKSMMEMHRMGLIKAIMRGRLSIEESGSGIKVIQIPKKEICGKKRIEYRELDARAIKASRRADDPEMGLFALMAALGGVPEDELDDMEPHDRRVVKDLGNCFLTI
jgi:hypothetical protein